MATLDWSKVDKHGPRAGRLGRCWMWMGPVDKDGYGRFKQAGKMLRAHRVSWGDVPPGLNVLHHCDNPPCVRRSHLWLGTTVDNNRDRDAKGRNGYSRRTHCPSRHPYTAANLLREGSTRKCRTCIRARGRIRYANDIVFAEKKRTYVSQWRLGRAA